MHPDDQPALLATSVERGVLRGELRLDIGGLEEIQSALRELWREAGRSADVRAVLLVIEGEPSIPLAGGPDADPTIGPATLGLGKPVVVLATTPVPAALFGILPEAVRVLASHGSGVTEDVLGSDEGVPRAASLDIPYQAMAELSLRGHLSAERARSVGLFHLVGSDEEMTAEAERLAVALAAAG